MTNMKKILAVATVLTITALAVCGQQVKTELLEQLENRLQVQQPLKGVTRGALRLFGEKDDLTTVIMIVPNGAEVAVLDRDSVYVHVKYLEYTGYLVADRVEITGVADTTVQREVQRQTAVQQEVRQQGQVRDSAVAVRQEARQQYQVSPENRMTYLEHKYGKNIASRIYAGKIWKGMTPEMVKDAWGEPDRINRVTRNNVLMEEWIYRSTWLLIEKGRLAEWGPVGR